MDHSNAPAQANASQPKSLFIVSLDFPREVEDESNRWFDYDHVPDRLSCAGFLGCERYTLTDVEPVGWKPAQRWTSYLNIYTVESPNVLETEAYDRQRLMNDGQGSRWRQARYAEHDKLGRISPSRMLRSAWVKRPSPWAPHSTILARPPRALFVVLRNIDPSAEETVNRYLDEEYVPELLGTPGFIGCERYVAAKSANLSQPGFVDVFDVSSPEVLTSQAFRQFQAANDVVEVSSSGGFTSQVFQRFQGAKQDSTRAQASRTIVASGVYTQRPSPWIVTIA